jgi:hypothetical protein
MVQDCGVCEESKVQLQAGDCGFSIKAYAGKWILEVREDADKVTVDDQEQEQTQNTKTASAANRTKNRKDYTGRTRLRHHVRDLLLHDETVTGRKVRV